MGSQAYTVAGSGTFTPSVSPISILLIGGGGSGEAAGGGGGGGGGESRVITNVTVTPGTPISYTVAANATGGVDGHDTTFGGYTAKGGKRGGGVTPGVGGLGGTGGTGGTGYNGGSGGSWLMGVGGGGGGAAGSTGTGSLGGSPNGGAGNSPGGNGGNGGDPPEDGFNYGGGGGGSEGMTDGGTGRSGYILITWADGLDPALLCGTQFFGKLIRGGDMIDLRQSTASQEIPIGPFLSKTDLSEMTALSIANTDIKLQKTGATSQVSKNSGGATHIANGNYYAVLDATDTDTVGPLKITVAPLGAIPVPVSCRVLSTAVYDQLYGSSAIGGGTPPTADAIADEIETRTLDCNVVNWAGETDPVDRFERAALAITLGTVGAGSTTTSIVTSSLDPAATALNQFKDQVVCFAADTATTTLRGHKTPILASDSSGVLSVKAMPAAPASGDKFTIQ